MAPAKASIEPLHPALADYFYIAGIESSQIFDETLRNAVPPPAPVETTIDEDVALITDAPTSPRPTTSGSLGGGDTPVRRSKRYSWEARKSLGSGIFSPTSDQPASNRTSSATIKAPQRLSTQESAAPTTQTAGSSSNANRNTFSEEDFEQALRKFATERDSFLEDIHVSAGTVTSTTQAKVAKPRPKTMRIVADENSGSLRSGVGSLRRRLSTMNSPRKSGAPARASTVSAAKRLSDYKSVIPAPEPFKLDPNMHPLKRRYEPVLLDRYPTSTMVEESKKRCAFPNFVPMFAFPYDAHVVSSDERPRSTWHGFAMTEADGSKVHSICVTVWTPLVTEAAAELERQCDAWRRSNMTEGEREMAASLGERLVSERANLSQLLSQLPTVPSGSPEREELEDQIGMVEERITLMADLLRPVRHAAASKIEGLTQNETGFWVPRVYGVLGKDGGLTGFWKEWLKAVIVPMTDGGVLNVPASSPRVGMWQPLERYVVNLCMEAPSPLTSITQIEVIVRELKIYARHDAVNELPGTRNNDLYALFRALSIPTIVTLFECALAESRIILLSSHTAMLHLASQALASLLYPLQWSGVFIPVLPARLLQALEAPCPYIIGVERRYENTTLPEDDFFMVDLDQDIMEGTAPPRPLPRQIRRKLTSLLQAAAPHHNRYGVPVGPPPYAIETFPMNLFSSENPQIFDEDAKTTNLAESVSMSSTSFSDVRAGKTLPPVYNAFVQARQGGERRPSARPGTSSTTQGSYTSSQAPTTPTSPSPASSSFPSTPVSRSDSAFGLQTTLREKRSGQLDVSAARRSSSVSMRTHVKDEVLKLIPSKFGLDRINPMRRPPVAGGGGGHSPSLSTSSLTMNFQGSNGSAPSIYAPSTLAASTIMPTALVQPVRDTENQSWVEGHCMMKVNRRGRGNDCAICNEKGTDVMFCCSGCSVMTHSSCVHQITLVCPAAFRPALVRAAFVRCFASLLYTYRRFLQNSSNERRKTGLPYHFKHEAFQKSLPADHAEYVAALRETTAFNEFIYERESKRAEDPTIKLFDEIIMSKRNRGKTSLFSRGMTNFLSDTSDHLWRSAASAPPSSRFPGDYRQVVSRIPAKLDTSLMKEPRANQGAPRIPKARTQRKPIPSMLGLNVDLAEGAIASAVSNAANASNNK